MGIDIYLSWEDMTEQERRAQLVGFAVDAGHVGYLREAYHGEPYATHVLMPEAFQAAAYRPEEAREAGLDVDERRAVHIPTATLRGRLEAACGIAIERGRKVYGEALTPESPEIRAFVDFVELAERLERQGRCPRVLASY